MKRKTTQMDVSLKIAKELTLLKKNIKVEFEKTLSKIKKGSNDNYEV
jgi:hypothetical protein